MTVEDLFELAPCGYVVLDRDHRVVRANRAFGRLVGRPVEEVVADWRFPRLLPVAARIYFETHLQPALDLHGHFDEVALEVVRPDGERVPVLVSANIDDEAIRVIVFEARHRRTFETNLLHATQEAERARAEATASAQRLQQTLIPPTPPRVPGLDIAAAYRPAGDGSVVGGDFYDVFQVSPTGWIVVVGDVEGKGIRAAAVTAFVRDQLRALAMQHDDPADVLRGLNATLLAHDVEHFCTLALVRVDPDADGCRVRLALGGHPRPMTSGADGSVVEVGTPGTLVGVFPEPVFTTVDLDLADRTLVLFTDGVTEARDEEGLYGEQRLAALVGRAAGRTAEEQVATIVGEILAFQGDVAADDIAVVALSPAPLPLPPQS
ncbi:PP2C family protein-serine/threonine phosphatase [Nocardioides sp. SYSU D00038]|uniref:PP2C family protein-serine/threonine phosphatase n=1 Tax=Nocardioides sp. SYSU D00038 TaxID=2812554 RepID=UPI001967CE9D|nr:SpoIIE family protein phosphatase [Nocardioides sp. SYSU D00038]